MRKKQKVRIRLNSFDYRSLDRSVEKIVETAKKSGAKVLGPIPLPTRKRRWCVLKSPHVNKRGGEHYQICIHNRLLDIQDPAPNTIDALTSLDLPAGVDVEVRLL